MIARVLAGFVIATIIAAGARRARALSRGGAIAAVLLGTVSAAAGWSWAALLIAFFLSSTALSRFRADLRERRTGAIVAKGGERDALQVLSNGGVFGAAALGFLFLPWMGWPFLAAGAIAAASADTWSTEIGTLARTPPRSIISLRPVPAGTSGGVSTAGTIAGAAGSGFIALLVLALGWEPAAALGALAGGFAGATADSLLGATLQSRWSCPTCGTGTERLVHHCGARTIHAGGVRWIDNDAVNLGACITGSIVASFFL